MDLHSLWDEIQNYGYNVRKNNLDGLKDWQEPKAKYSKFYIAGREDGIIMNNNFHNIENKIQYIIGQDTKDHQDVIVKIDNIELDNRIDKYHFFIQHFRIPKLENYKLSVLKLLQIAYNSGQFKADAEANKHDKKVIDFYYDNDLDKITTFIDEKLVGVVPEQIKVGGDYNYNYKRKYYKYKTKYLKLKNKI